MGIRVQGLQYLQSYLEKESQKVVDEIIYRLNFLGNDAVRYIRDRSKEDSWEDQTGNLRSSIGYIIVKDGMTIGESGFEKVNGPDRDKTDVDGSVEGRAFAEKLATKYQTGYALIVVAGMEYAAVLEKLDNKDVLASGELYLKRRIKKMLNEMKKKYAR